MNKLNKRLSDLEAQTGAMTGTVVLWSDLNEPGVYWDQPYYEKERRKYTEEEKQELETEYEYMFVVRYVQDWRSVS